MRSRNTIIGISILIIVMQSVIACGGLSGKQKQAAERALGSLRKVESAAQVGSSYQQYNLLVIEAKSQIDETSRLLPEGELKKELEAARDAYVDALTIWRQKSDPNPLHPNTEPGKTLIPKYRLRVEKFTMFGQQHEYAPIEEALTIIWRAGQEHVERAARLLSQ